MDPVTQHKDSPEEIDRFETREWLDSLRYVLETRGPERAAELMRSLQIQDIDGPVLF